MPPGITPQEYLIFSAALFFIGIAGVVARRNLFVVFFSIELMLNAVNLSLVTFSRLFNQLDGMSAVFLVIAVAAAEAALGLAIVILIFRQKETLSVDDYDQLQG